jgi:hypothetical protein
MVMVMDKKMIHLDLTELESDKIAPVEHEEVIIRMDSRMLRQLEAQALFEGFSDVDNFIFTILFRDAVAVYLENLGELERLEQDAAFTREIRDWLVRR